MLRWLCYKKSTHTPQGEGVEAPLDIKDVIYQISCFSKTMMMNITLPSMLIDIEPIS